MLSAMHAEEQVCWFETAFGAFLVDHYVHSFFKGAEVTRSIQGLHF